MTEKGPEGEGEGLPVIACGGWFLKWLPPKSVIGPGGMVDLGGKMSNGPVPCKRWDCDSPLCGPAKVKYYYALACKGMGVVAGELPPAGHDLMLLTLTTDPKKHAGKPEAWRAMGYTFKKFRERLRYHYGKFEYMGVTEATKEGWPHIHLIVKGLSPVPVGWYEVYKPVGGKWARVTDQKQKEGRPHKVIRVKSDTGKPTLADMAEESGFGFITDLRSVQFDNAKGAANYLLGYIKKSLTSRSYPPGYRRVRWSKGWPGDGWERPEALAGLGLLLGNAQEAEAVTGWLMAGVAEGFSIEYGILTAREFGARALAKNLLAGQPPLLAGGSGRMNFNPAPPPPPPPPGERPQRPEPLYATPDFDQPPAPDFWEAGELLHATSGPGAPPPPPPPPPPL